MGRDSADAPILLLEVEGDGGQADLLKALVDFAGSPRSRYSRSPAAFNLAQTWKPACAVTP